MIPPPTTLEPWMDSVLSIASRKACPSREGFFTRADLYQEGWLVLGKIIKYFSPKRGLTLEKYVLVMLLRHLRWFLMQEGEKRKPQRLPEEFEAVAPPVRSELEDDREGTEALRVLSRGLPDNSQELFRLRFMEGLGQKEIAQRLGVNKVMVAKRFVRYRPTLKANARRLIGAA